MQYERSCEVRDSTTGDLDADVDPAQLTFEISALLDQANSLYVLWESLPATWR